MQLAENVPALETSTAIVPAFCCARLQLAAEFAQRVLVYFCRSPLRYSL
jgi:hypothetical protein